MKLLQNIDYSKYITYLLIAYAFSFPLSKAATNIFEALILVLWVLEAQWKEKFLLYKNNIFTLSIALLLGFSLVSILWHGNLEISLRYIFKYRHFFLIFVFYSSFDRRYTNHIIGAFIFAMFISELFSYAIFFELIHYKDRLPSDPSPFMFHTTYSTVLAFTISILLIKFLNTKNLKYKIFYALFFITATINLFINGGRTGQIIFIVLILITIFSYVKHKLKAALFSVFILFITFFLAFSFSTNFQNRSKQLYNDFDNMITKHEYSQSGAIKVALTTLGYYTYKDYPLLGTGLSYSMKDIEQYANEHGFDGKFLKTFSDYHNSFVTLSVQLGVIGLLISLLIIYSLLTFKITNKEYKTMSILFAVSFLLFSLTQNTLHTMNPMIFFTLFSGLFNALSKRKIIITF
ncbi:O-antigen ligase family protein [Sulfurimonas sp.]